MNAKHTPGPWEAEDNSWEVSCVYCDGKEIARVQIDNEADEDSQHQFERVKEANARLIAAAPDLLEALQEVVPMLEHMLMIRGEPQPGSIGHKARAAITKATGGAA